MQFKRYDDTYFMMVIINSINYPQGNSNPRFLREKEMSSASRRWGLFLFK